MMLKCLLAAASRLIDVGRNIHMILWLAMVPNLFTIMTMMVMSATWIHLITHGPLTCHAKLRVAHAPGMPGTFPATDFKGNR